MNTNSSSNGLSWTAPVPIFFVLFLVVVGVVVFVVLFFSSSFSLSEEVFLTAVCAFEHQTKFVKS